MAKGAVLAVSVLVVIAAYYAATSQHSHLPSWPRFYLSQFLQSSLSSLSQALLPPPAWLLTQMVGFNLSKALYLACKFEFADYLHSGPLSVEQIAGLAHTAPGETERVLKYLAARGVFERAGDRTYANTATSDYLRRTHPQSVWPVIVHFDFVARATVGYAAVLQGSPKAAFQEAFDTDLSVWDYIALPENREEKEAGDLAMMSVSAHELEAIFSDYPWSLHAADTVVDVGGGVGHLTAAILRRFPCSGVVFDEAIPVREGVWKDRYSDVVERATFVEGSFFQSVWVGGDVYVLKRVIHDWPDSESVSILSNIAAAMQATKKSRPSSSPVLLLIDAVYDFPPRPPLIAEADFMIMYIRGKERDVGEFEEILREAGLRMKGVYRTRSMMSVIEAELT